ncbi:MAG: AAA family ATPase [Gemmatimonadaceae bacterium]
MLDDGDAQRLVASRDHVPFEPHGATIDLHDVREMVGASTNEASIEVLRDVAPMLRGTLLAGLDLPDCYAYSSWLAAERDGARTLRQSVLSTLVRRLAASPDEALGFARELVTVDPFDDTTYAPVIELLGAVGRVRDARDEFENCRRIMKRELGREPGAVVERARLKAEGHVPPLRSGRQQPVRISTVIRALPASFVGRADELAQLVALVAQRSASPGCDVVLVTGEPGIGKSRLLDELGTMVSAHGGVVLRGRAFEAEMIRPYGPWVDALPDIVAIPSAEGGVRDRQDLFETARRLISADSPPGNSVAVLLDDLQWFDDSSVALLHFIARGPSETRIIIGLSARTATLATNAAALTAIRALRRAGKLHELSLGPLSHTEIATLATSVNADVDAGQVAAASGGNPLYALAVTRSLAAGETTVPRRIESIIDDHLATLNDRARDLIMWAAALGTSLSTTIEPTRRSFLGPLAARAAAGAGVLGLAGGMLARPASLEAAGASEPGPDSEKWLDGLKGKHRQLADVYTANDGFPLGFAHNFLATQGPGQTAGAVVVLRHFAMPIAVGHDIWGRSRSGRRSRSSTRRRRPRQ